MATSTRPFSHIITPSPSSASGASSRPVSTAYYGPGVGGGGAPAMSSSSLSRSPAPPSAFSRHASTQSVGQLSHTSSSPSSPTASMRPFSAFQPLDHPESYTGGDSLRPSASRASTIGPGGKPGQPGPANPAINATASAALTFKSPDLRSALALQAAQSAKVYMEGYLLRRIDRNTDGKTLHPSDPARRWAMCFAQLGGTVLSVWDVAEMEAAAAEGREVPPTYINIQDSFVDYVGLVFDDIDGVPAGPGTPNHPSQSDHASSRGRRDNVFALNSAGSNRVFFCAEGPHSNRLVQSWVNAIRLAAWEKSRLEEIYTGALIKARLGAVSQAGQAGPGGDGAPSPSPSTEMRVNSPLVKGKMEGWVKARFMGSTEWKKCWLVVSDHAEPEKHDSEGGNRGSLVGKKLWKLGGAALGHHSRDNSTASESRSASKPLSEKSSLLSANGQPDHAGAIAHFYEAKKAKRPFASLIGAAQAFAVYPSRPELVEGSSLFKVEATFPTMQHSVLNANGRIRNQGWVMIMPELEGIAGKGANAEMMKWVIGFMDAFRLYGRPANFIWDARSPQSVFFAYPIGPYRDRLFLDRELTEFLDVRENRSLHVRANLHGIMAARMRGERTPVLQPLPQQEAPATLEPAANVGGPDQRQQQQQPDRQSQQPSQQGAAPRPVAAQEPAHQQRAAENAERTLDDRPSFQPPPSISLPPLDLSIDPSRPPYQGPQVLEPIGELSREGSMFTSATSPSSHAAGGAGIGVGGGGRAGSGSSAGASTFGNTMGRRHGSMAASSMEAGQSMESSAASLEGQPAPGPPPAVLWERERNAATNAAAQRGQGFDPAGAHVSIDPSSAPTVPSANNGVPPPMFANSPNPRFPVHPAPALPSSAPTGPPPAVPEKPWHDNGSNSSASLNSANTAGARANGAVAAPPSPPPAQDKLLNQQQTPTPTAQQQPRTTDGAEYHYDEPGALFYIGMSEALPPFGPPPPAKATERPPPPPQPQPQATPTRPPPPKAEISVPGGLSERDSVPRKKTSLDEGLAPEAAAAYAFLAQPPSPVDRSFAGESRRSAASPSTDSHTADSARSSKEDSSFAGPRPAGSGPFPSSFARNKKGAERMAAAKQLERAQQEAMHRPGKANKDKGVRGTKKARNAWGSSSEEDEESAEEEEEASSDEGEGATTSAGALNVPGPRHPSNLSPSSNPPQRRASRTLPPPPGVPNISAHEAEEFSRTAHAAGLPFPPTPLYAQHTDDLHPARPVSIGGGASLRAASRSPSRYSGGDDRSARTTSTPPQDSDQPRSGLGPTHVGPGSGHPLLQPSNHRSSMFANVLGGAHGDVYGADGQAASYGVAGGAPANAKQTFVSLDEEPTTASMSKAFAPHGLLQAGAQDKAERSARQQEMDARAKGEGLVHMPNKPVEPQVGLVGAINAHQAERKREGGFGATLTERERDRRVQDQRMKEMEEQGQLQPYMQGGMFPGNPYMNPWAMQMQWQMMQQMAYQQAMMYNMRGHGSPPPFDPRASMAFDPQQAAAMAAAAQAYQNALSPQHGNLSSAASVAGVQTSQGDMSMSTPFPGMMPPPPMMGMPFGMPGPGSHMSMIGGMPMGVPLGGGFPSPGHGFNNISTPSDYAPSASPNLPGAHSTTSSGNRSPR